MKKKPKAEKVFALQTADGDYVDNKSNWVQRWGKFIRTTEQKEDAKHWKTKAGAQRAIDNKLTEYKAEVARMKSQSKAYYNASYYSKQIKNFIKELEGLTIIEFDYIAPEKSKIKFSESSWYLSDDTKPSKQAYCRVCGIYFNEIPALTIHGGRGTFRICPFCLQEWGEKGRDLVRSMDKKFAEEVEQERFVRKL